jgi:uncharacterized membrane protein YfcA
MRFDYRSLTRIDRLSAFHCKRLQIWALLVLGIVLLVTIKAVVPQGTLPGPFSAGLAAVPFLAIFLAALACEYMDSSLGMGYGTTLTPLLLLGGFNPAQIVPCVLLSECITGFASILMHHHDGNVNLLRDRQARRTAGLLLVLSTIGAILAVAVALRASEFWLKAIIAVVILSAGVTVLVTLRRRVRYRPSHMIAVGAIAAFNKAISGGGYGPLVTAGQVVSGISPRQAVAITSLAEGFTCMVGLAAYWSMGGSLDLAVALPLVLGGVLSVPVATLTVRQLPEHVMRTAVGIATCTLAILTLATL